MNLQTFKKELETELQSILQYWIKNAPDPLLNGFYGRINENNTPDPRAPKGSVLNARILWTFSAAYNRNPRPEYLIIAKRAYDFIRIYFTDKEYGGIYWTVDSKGHPLDTKNQVYAIAFVIYACSEYYQCKPDESVKKYAVDLYHLIQQHSYDALRGGYLEAFTREWKPIADLRLSEKDANEKKTMNTHLHILEAYSNLYRIWSDEHLKKNIEGLCQVFAKYIFNPHTKHLGLFFDENWTLKSSAISFGHDIEASWLLCEAAEVTGNKQLLAEMHKLAVDLAESVHQKGFDTDGGLWYEYDHNTLVKEKHWWPQAEAMVGFFNAWQIAQHQPYLDRVLANWQYIKENIIDHQHREWYWGRYANNQIMPGQDKAGLWKCPYHNSRACMELIQRIERMEPMQQL